MKKNMKMQRRNYLHQKKMSIVVISVFVTSKQKCLQFMRAKRPKVNNPFLLDFITVITLPIQKCRGLSDVGGANMPSVSSVTEQIEAWV